LKTKLLLSIVVAILLVIPLIASNITFAQEAIPTYSFLAVVPNPVGVGQDL
jgi:hypothetical protein